jgi:hypothetical protein
MGRLSKLPGRYFLVAFAFCLRLIESSVMDDDDAGNAMECNKVSSFVFYLNELNELNDNCNGHVFAQSLSLELAPRCLRKKES